MKNQQAVTPMKRALTTNQAMTVAAKMATEARKAIMNNDFYLSPKAKDKPST